MKKRLKSFILGIADGIFPSLGNSIVKKEDGERDVDFARFLAAFFGWLFWVASLIGWIKPSEALSFLRMIFMLG
jgi:hypothetical protein